MRPLLNALIVVTVVMTVADVNALVKPASELGHEVGDGWADTVNRPLGLANYYELQADKCEAAGKSGYDQINSVYDPKLDLFLKIAAALKAKGFDPKHYPVVFPDGRVEALDLTDTVKNLATQKATAYLQVKKAVDDCNQSFATPQKVLDAAVFFATGGLSAVLPPSFTHIDASQILSGTVFGGPNALIPKLRDDILGGLGIGGDVACIIRDPKKIFGGC